MDAGEEYPNFVLNISLDADSSDFELEEIHTEEQDDTHLQQFLSNLQDQNTDFDAESATFKPRENVADDKNMTPAKKKTQKVKKPRTFQQADEEKQDEYASESVSATTTKQTQWAVRIFKGMPRNVCSKNTGTCTQK